MSPLDTKPMRRPKGGTTVLIPPSPPHGGGGPGRRGQGYRCAAQAHVLLRTYFDFLFPAGRGKLCEARAARGPSPVIFYEEEKSA